MEDYLRKKFKFGIVLNKYGDNTVENIISYLNEFKEAIGRIYFSPIKEYFATRGYIYNDIDKNYSYYFESLIKISDFCFNNDIKISFAINTGSQLSLKEFNDYQKNIKFDEIITLSSGLYPVRNTPLSDFT